MMFKIILCLLKQHFFQVANITGRTLCQGPASVWQLRDVELWNYECINNSQLYIIVNRSHTCIYLYVLENRSPYRFFSFLRAFWCLSNHWPRRTQPKSSAISNLSPGWVWQQEVTILILKLQGLFIRGLFEFILNPLEMHPLEITWSCQDPRATKNILHERHAPGWQPGCPMVWDPANCWVRI